MRCGAQIKQNGLYGRKHEMKPDFWKGRNVFITGATGFIGSWLTGTLVEKGAHVVILVRDEHPKEKSPHLEESYSKLSGIVWGDITNYGVIERIFNEYEIDTCFHLAAQAIVGVANRAPLSTFESNIKGTWNILEVARNSQMLKRLVIASSDKAYGEHEGLPYTEEYHLNAIHPYDTSKACADMLAHTYFHTYGLSVAITRCANTYGGGDLNFSRIIPDTIRSVLQGKNPVIRSDGTPVRDYLYVLDAVNAYLTLAEKMDSEEVRGQVFNFGTESPVTVLDLVNTIIRISGRTSLKPVVAGKGKTRGEIQKQYLSIEKAKRMLGWTPKYSLEKGLEETIKWYENFLAELT